MSLHFNRIFHYKSSILGYPWVPPFMETSISMPMRATAFLWLFDLAAGLVEDRGWTECWRGQPISAKGGTDLRRATVRFRRTGKEHHGGWALTNVSAEHGWSDLRLSPFGTPRDHWMQSNSALPCYLWCRARRRFPAMMDLRWLKQLWYCTNKRRDQQLDHTACLLFYL